MSADPVSAMAAAGRWPTTVVAARTARLAVRSGALWGCVFALYVTSSSLGYASTYNTAAERDQLAATFGSNAGINALIGPAHQIQTVAGFTAWRSLGVLSILGAVWGLLAGTRLLRGEEEAGRWELLLAGQTTRRRAAGQALGGLAAGLLTLWIIPAVASVLIGRSSKVDFSASSALFLAVALVSSAAVFLAAGALASQLAPTRRQAASYAAAALGVAYALRMAADSGTGLEWLRWATPLGWIEELRPLTAPRPLALLPIVALVAVVSGLAVHLAGIRDLGASTIPDRDRSAARTWLLSGPTGLALRLIRPLVVGWGTATALGGLLVGLIAKSAGSALASSSSFQQVISRLGARGAGAKAYLGVSFLIVALMVALIAAGQISAVRAEEAEGRLDQLLVRPVARWSWLLGRLAVTAGLMVVAGLMAGVFAWLGAASQNSGVGLVSLVEAALNLIPPGVFVLGAGALALGVRPRVASGVAYGVVAWSFLVELIGGIVNANHWLLDTSVFHHMSAAPAVNPNWTTDAVLVALGVAACGVGAIAFSRRDLAGA
jgi:ABC-2 type transport system permease protein